MTEKALNKIKSSRFERKETVKDGNAKAAKKDNCGNEHHPDGNNNCPSQGKTCSNSDTLNHYAQCCMKDPANRHRELTLKEEEIILKPYVDQIEFVIMRYL